MKQASVTGSRQSGREVNNREETETDGLKTLLAIAPLRQSLADALSARQVHSLERIFKVWWRCTWYLLCCLRKKLKVVHLLLPVLSWLPQLWSKCMQQHDILRKLKHKWCSHFSWTQRSKFFSIYTISIFSISIKYCSQICQNPC